MMSDAGLKYLKVILPLKLDWEPCYSYAPADGAAVPEIGSRVNVRFAGRRYIGVVSGKDIVPEIEASRICMLYKQIFLMQTHLSAKTTLHCIMPLLHLLKLHSGMP